MIWYLRIERVSNGFIVVSNPEDDQEEYTRLISWTDQTDSKLNAYQELLWEVAEHFGMTGSKYDGQRIAISIEPGSHYDDSILHSEGEEGPNCEERTSSLGADGSSLGHPVPDNRTDVYGSEEQYTLTDLDDDGEPIYERAEDEA